MAGYFKPSIALCFLLSFIGVCGQTVTVNDFFTATTANASGTMAVGTNDLHWKVSNSGINGPYVQALSCGYVYNGWHFSNTLNANWISYPNTCVSGDFAEHSCLNPIDQDRFYKNSFYLPGTGCESTNLTPGLFCLTLDMRADNCIYEVFVNGLSVFTTNIPNPYWHMGFATGAAEVLTLCNNWKSGLNEIIVHVTSSAGAAPTWEGLLATATMTFNGVANQTIVPLSVSATGSTFNCTSQNTGTASVSVISAGANITYTWLPSGGNAATASNLSAGIYTVIVSNGICTKTETVNVHATNVPTLNINGPLKTVCRGESVTLSATGTQFYNWQPGNGNTSSINVLAAGATVYTVTGSNSNGCSSTKTISITGNECTDMERMMAEYTRVSVLPNPSSAFFIVQHPTNTNLTLYNTLGRIVFKSVSKLKETKIDVAHLPDGIYYLSVQTSEQKAETIKVLIER